jgi:uncharacterized protein (DUF433 family)
MISLIDMRPGVRGGKPCFVGTRIAVYDVLEYLASGMTTDEVVADFPELTTEHVRAALSFAATREHRLAAPTQAVARSRPTCGHSDQLTSPRMPAT